MNTDEPVGEMNQPATEPPTTWREQVALFRNAKGLLRLVVFFALLFCVAAFLLGALFQGMALALSIAFVHLMGVYTPAYHLMGRIMGLKGLPTRLAKPPTWFIFYSWLWAVFMLGIFAFIVRLLFIVGFCPQNIFCVLALAL